MATSRMKEAWRVDLEEFNLFLGRKIERAKRTLRPHFDVCPDWSWLMKDKAWLAARDAAKDGPRVLISTLTGSNWAISTMDSVLGVALTMAGARVSYLLCDGALHACQECDHQWLSPAELAKHGPQNRLCGTCSHPHMRCLLLRGSRFCRSVILCRHRSA